ncbi:MAG: hypothetical protein WC372_09900 [Candidatus Neomarinimicrobiota bacterium]|jgi:hypothetical protein
MRDSALLYYFPAAHAGGMFSDDISALPEGLRYRFRRRTSQQNVAGPDRGRGLLITPQQDVLISYNPERQTWRKCGAHWIGYRNDYQSADFAKRDARGDIMAPGYAVELGGGRMFTIPVALADMPNCRIPWRETLDETGAVIRELDPAYQDVCLVAQMLFDHITEDDQFQMAEDLLRRACAQAVAVNYDLTHDECLALGLFTSESYQRIISAILDLPAVDEILKKKAGEASPAASGGKTASPATPSLTPTT